jgi:hypothetical protein
MLMFKKLIHLISPKWLKKLISNLAECLYSECKLNHKFYGKVRLPFYEMYHPLTSSYPEIYNKNGEKIELFFLRNDATAFGIYSGSSYFQWDRYNFGLNTHFYSDNLMLNILGKPVRKYGMIIESEVIVPQYYALFEKHKGLEKDFDLIFTHSARLLDSLSNARFVPWMSSISYTPPFSIGTESVHGEGLYKTKGISIISSLRTKSELNKYRLALALECKEKNLADTFGTFDGGPYVSYADTLTDYRFAIAIENDIKPYWFTERITSCFAAKTIPIYLGASAIDKFFNADGIITFTQNDDIGDVLKKCTPALYEERLPAILDNFNRVKNYNVYDYMYKKYLMGNDPGKQSPEFYFK